MFPLILRTQPAWNWCTAVRWNISQQVLDSSNLITNPSYAKNNTYQGNKFKLKGNVCTHASIIIIIILVIILSRTNCGSNLSLSIHDAKILSCCHHHKAFACAFYIVQVDLRVIARKSSYELWELIRNRAWTLVDPKYVKNQEKQ